jgi:hypothetical protein
VQRYSAGIERSRASSGGELYQAIFDFDPIGFKTYEGGHAGCDPKAGAPFAENVTAKESRFFKSGDGGKDFFRITGKVTRVASGPVRPSKKASQRCSASASIADDFVRYLAGLGDHIKLFERHGSELFSLVFR